MGPVQREAGTQTACAEEEPEPQVKKAPVAGNLFDPFASFHSKATPSRPKPVVSISLIHKCRCFGSGSMWICFEMAPLDPDPY